jgi:hypothetical protein
MKSENGSVWISGAGLKMKFRRIKERKGTCLIVALVVLLPAAGFSQTGVRVSDFKVMDWFRSVKLTWRATAPDGSEGLFEIYRSDKIRGSYVLVQEVKLGDKKFIDAITKTYVFYDKKLKVGRRYYYKLTLRGADQAFGPLDGLASGAPPGT